jgi:molecular chaperone DnaK
MTARIEFGIDLGTTNSCIARFDGADVRVFQNNDQMSVTPSVVHVLKSGRLLVGKRAYNAGSQDPLNTASEFKRWIGQRDTKSFPSSGKTMSAEELSAEVLKSLTSDVRRLVGEQIDAAVVTVPAAFGALQCEATARAAKLAGLVEAPLLQEPIAAAIAYGINSSLVNQRWLIFDLGGGTLDIAVVSTRDGRLTVLEHRGNNLLGGKDIDRRIVDGYLMPALDEAYQVPGSDDASGRFESLYRRLLLKAEEAKIDLTSNTSVMIEMFDLGEDLAGEPIELEYTLKRSDLEREVEPLLQKCCDLAKEAIAGARTCADGIDKILLVGGPTQMPIIREALESRLGIRVDYSVDPMTVVARGAAIYASGLERSVQAVAVSKPGTVSAKLAYEPVCTSLRASVAGSIDLAGFETPVEVKLDSESGHWSSGWIRAEEGLFETNVFLEEGKQTRFWLYARDKTGRILEVTPAELSIRHGIVVSALPLPHTVSVEIVRQEGSPELDAVFPKGTPLPAKRSVRYRADHSVSPGKDGKPLAVKLWEGEVLEDPLANEWIGRLQILPEDVRRTIPEGAELELSIEIDASRLLSVDAFVPALNQHFSERVYVPQREEKYYAQLVSVLPEELEEHNARIVAIERASPDDPAVETLREEVASLEKAANVASAEATKHDPDLAKRLVEESRSIRGRLSRLERSAGVNRQAAAASESAGSAVAMAEEVVARFGTASDKAELTALKAGLSRAEVAGDCRGLGKATDDLNGIRWRILFRHDWFWREIFDSMRRRRPAFTNVAEAARAMRMGEEAIESGDSAQLRSAVQILWDLQPSTAENLDRDIALRAGLRRY